MKTPRCTCTQVYIAFPTNIRDLTFSVKIQRMSDGMFILEKRVNLDKFHCTENSALRIMQTVRVLRATN